MKNNQKLFQGLFLISLFFSCNFDENPPAVVDNVRGWFTINENNIGVNLSWNHSNDNDFQKYIIYKSKSGGIVEEIAETEDNFFKDSNVEWLEYYNYFVQSVDKVGNESDLSDTLLLRIYSVSGNWDIENFDSTFLCIDHNQTISTSSGSFEQKGYFLSDGYELILNDDSNDSTSFIGDTIISKMLFSACNIDSSSLVGNGWMTYQITILDTTVNGDTIKPINNNFPVYFDMDLNNPNSGSISFSSPLFDKLTMRHSLKFCNGNDIFN